MQMHISELPSSSTECKPRCHQIVPGNLQHTPITEHATEDENTLALRASRHCFYVIRPQSSAINTFIYI